MNRRRLHRCLLWLLPLLILRAFVPAGFMLAPSAAGLQLVLCSGGSVAPSPISSDANAHAHHIQSEHADGSTGQHSEHQAHELSICPYAVAGTSQAPGVAHFLADAPLASVSIVASPADPSLVSVPVLIDRIRGPPLA